MKNVVMGTAGHVDHGKTSLIEVLTGINCDRLAEEKEREITIDIGFAHMAVGGGRTIGIVDVPGHERFVKNMLAGVAGIDFVLLVVAADDGVMPQTLEHLDICGMLRVQKGVVALTKIDMVEPDWAGMIAEDVRKTLRGTFLDGAPVVPVSSHTKQGIPELIDAIERVVESISPRNEWGPVRLPIDRAFTMKGAGTVVTGTLVSGTLKLNQELALLPAGDGVRVRQIQVHGVKKEEAGAGQRCAVNLVGVDVGDVKRGNVLAEPGFLDAAHTIDVKAQAIARLARPIKNRSRIRLHTGTQEIIGRICFFDREELAAGRECYARIRLEAPAVCAHRDLFILRMLSPVETVGGGVVLDSKPNLRRRAKEQIRGELARREKGSAEEVVEQAIADFGLSPASAKEISARINIDPAEAARAVESLIGKKQAVIIKDTDKVITRAAFENLKSQILSRMSEYFTAFPKKPWISLPELRTKYFGKVDGKVVEFAVEAIKDEGKLAVSVSARGYRLLEGSGAVLKEEERIRAEMEKLFQGDIFNPPGRQEILEKAQSRLIDVQEAFQVLVDAGTIVKVGSGAYLHREAITAARGKIVSFLKGKGEISIGEAKDLLNTSRKFIIPLMEYFDSANVTIRDGDRRRLHPKQS